MKKEKKRKENAIKEAELENASGGETYRVTYSSETVGNYNVSSNGTGEQMLDAMDKLIARGMFDNLKKEG